jgi:diguanylate cyclase
MKMSADRKRRVLVAVAVVAIATCVSAVWVGLRVGGAGSVRDFDDTATALAALVATGFCVRAALRHRGQMRLFWSLLAGATLCWTLAEVTWAVYELVLRMSVPVPSWADLGYLGAVPFAVAALLCHPAMNRAARRRARSLFDSLIVATALVFLSWTLVVGPLWHSTDLSTLGGLVAIAYPFGDVVIVFFILSAVRERTGVNRLALWCLLAGLLMMALSDSTYTYLTTTNSYATGNLIDVGWIAAYLTIALAAFSSEPSTVRQWRIRATDAPTRASFLAPFVPAVVALGVAGFELELGHHLDHAATLMALGLVVLVLGRQTLLALEAATLVDSKEGHSLRALIRVALGRPTVATPKQGRSRDATAPS